mmetsp:Transcript_3091/g.4974  ORF Transcript_3091/g.4974 Transcript_3091/m.4974 type:complete len:239 (-) Transcript_3091:20-736(-)
MGRVNLAAALLTEGARGADRVNTSFTQDAQSSQVKTVELLTKGLDAFDSDFQAYAKTDKHFPPLLMKRWQSIYNAKDPILKIKDRMWQCDNYEQALTGPRPDVKGQVADQLMKSSVSARVNAVVSESSELVSMCEKAERLIGDKQHPGIADSINLLIKKMGEAKKPIHDMMVGSDDAGDTVTDPVKEAGMPFLAALLQAPPSVLLKSESSQMARKQTAERRNDPGAWHERRAIATAFL